MKRRKIAINALVMDQYKAGIGNYVYNLIRELVKQNDQYDIDIYINESVREQFQDSKRIKFIIRGPYNGSMQRIVDEQTAMPYIYSSADYDFIHFLDYHTPFVKINKPFIVNIYDLSFYRYPEVFTTGSRLIKKIITPLSLCRASKVVALSKFTKDEIMHYFPEVNTDKIHVIHPGVSYKSSSGRSFEKIKEVLKKYGIEDNYILYVGTLEPRKNIMSLVKSMKEIWTETDISSKLVIAGKKGWLYQEVFDEVLKNGVEDKVIFTGYVSDEHLPYIYSGADMFIYPSIYEGFGLPPVEAMACGIPVITSNCSSLPEAVEDAALLVDPYKVSDIKDAIKKVYQDNALRRTLISKGFERIKTLTWKATAENVLEIYDDMRVSNKKQEVKTG